MAAASDLLEAAQDAWTNLEPFAIAGSLRSNLILFCNQAIASFPQALEKGHPVANWLAVLMGFAETMASTAGDYSLLRIAAQYVYRLCLMGYNLSGVIPTETTALLDAYNDNL